MTEPTTAETFPPIEIIVERSKWLRGQQAVGEKSYLFRSSDSEMCCLGFAALACGLTVPDIRNKTIPLALEPAKRIGPGFGRLMFGSDPLWRYHKSITVDLMIANDSPDISDREREERIIQHGKTIGFMFKFVD